MYDEKVKQVIVVRADLKMRRGKEIAQGSHASVSFLSHAYRTGKQVNGATREVFLTPEQQEWLYSGRFTKICVKVNSEAELDEIYAQAKACGLTVHLIIDAGLTEFDGVPTKTCLAIGPHFSSKIDPITGSLKLY